MRKYPDHALTFSSFPTVESSNAFSKRGKMVRMKKDSREKDLWVT